MLAISFVACTTPERKFRTKLKLSGEWEFALDTANIGIKEKWFANSFSENVSLPGTTDTNKKGFVNTDTTTLHLNRPYTYEGAAWYRKKILIPEDFNGKHVELFLERTKTTQVWFDSTFIGSSKLLQTPHIFDLSNLITPGEHYITVMVDNNLKLTPYGNVHIYSDDTQTNWNGIIGDMYLEASPKLHITNLQVYPDITKKAVDIKFGLANNLTIKKQNIKIELIVKETFKGNVKRLPVKTIDTTYSPTLELSYTIGDYCKLWSEFSQPLYELEVVISNEKIKDAQKVTFGMRNFDTNGTKFTINGTTTFLRGKHEAGVFPITGYTPTDVEEWKRVYQIAKTYGINHYRFHTYCPPEAAFTAADEEGIYLQIELPFWGGMDADSIAAMQLEEGYAMLDAYANHPSCVMISPGNEIWSGHDSVEKNMVTLKAYDNRPLYTMGSNNNIGYVEPRSYVDYFVGSRTPSDGDTIKTHTRLTHAYADSNEGGMLNTLEPSTKINFDYPVSQLNMPIISHEIGQYQIYPNYSEIEKYTGVLKAWNLDKFRQSLEKSGMADMDSIFQKASGAWSAICYKAEMEAALRTKGLGGFQLLDLQDFPGQGTALVGVLDAFMDSKNVVTPETWKQSCNDVVLLAEFDKFCYTNEESFQSSIVLSNYSQETVKNTAIKWILRDKNKQVIKEGLLPESTFSQGTLTTAGNITINLADVVTPSELTLVLKLEGTHYTNKYPLWVYPTNNPINSNNILVTETLNKTTLEKLENGSTVLLFPTSEMVKENSFAGHFPPEFWNYGMFKSISENVNKPISPGTLGLLMDPKHPLFDLFPTEFYTNWQWFSIIKESNSLILDTLPKDYKPIIQVIDNLERNHKLGMIFEFKFGKGKLLVCTSQLENISEEHPEAKQLYNAIITYMQSADFNPATSINEEELKQLFH
ncbi:sugar-binding domain-containing protein [Pustulibacterium marinum]|nr:sugar-binding domain-containing protein [Pustulibacterium marinum]